MEHLPGMSERDILEGLSQDQLLDLIQADLGKIAVLRTQITLASDVLAGAYGIDIDRVLEEREKDNGSA